MKLVVFLGLLVVCSMTAYAALLNPSAIGPEAGLNYSDLYESVNDAWYQPQYNVTQLITNGSCSSAAPCLWVPWYGSSSSCLATGEGASGNLKDGTSCNSGETINATNNCMVSDEFSQVGVVHSMGRNQTRFQHWFNTVNVINSSRARIPAWRVYKSGNTIEACRTGVNTNCDTASDATGRIIIALWNAANNTYFTNQTPKDNYAELARNLTIAMVQSEITFSCKNSTIGSGNICYWLRAGNQSSLTSTDGGYTGYYADVEIALLQTCSQTGNMTYCAVAGNLSLNYKQAAKWNGSAFRAPPGRSYKWDNFSAATPPYANCTNTCGDSAVDGDETWDASDAVRAFFEGAANYYDRYLLQANVLANSTAYMGQWVAEKMVGNLNSVPLQYYPNGNNSGSNQSGYKAQGLQAAGLMSQNNATQVNTTVWNALDHYTHATYKWDSAACPGVYDQSFSIRMLGVGMGRDAGSFVLLNASNASPPVVQTASILPATAFANDSLRGYCNATDPQGDVRNYTVQWFKNGGLNLSVNVTSVCYQEFANQSTTCGGLGTGRYAHETSYYYMNYTKPNTNMSATWQVKHGVQAWDGSTITTVPYNVSIPGACMSAQATTLQLRFYSDIVNFVGKSYGQCYNGTQWLNATNTSESTFAGYDDAAGAFEDRPVDGDWATNAYGTADWGRSCGLPNSNCATGRSGSDPSAEIYAAVWEEGVYWTLNVTQGIAQNVGSLPYTLAKSQQWILSCRATDNTSMTSAWVNSTTLTITNSAPTNNWSANNLTFNHNTSTVFGDYCADVDADTISYSTNTTMFPILANGSINYTANITSSGVASVNITCGDGSANTTRTATFNVTNTAPNVTSVALTPLPAQAGTTLNITYACQDADNDACNVTVFYQWFKNGVLNTSITGATLGSGNFTSGDNITGSVRVYDGNQNSTWANTSTATVGDTTPPVVTSFSVTPQSVTTAASTNISVTCTDNNQLGTVYAEIADTLGTRTNFSMTLLGGSGYAYLYTPPLAGTYSARAFCLDGNGNSANSSSIPFTASAAASGGGGGGGGTTTITTVVQQSNTTYKFASNFVDKGTFLMLSFDEEPYSFSIPVPVNKQTKYCSIDLPLSCTVNPDGTQVLVTYTENDHDFLTKTIYGQLRATSTSDEVALTQVKIGVVNVGYSVLDAGTINVTAGPTNKYLIRIKDGAYAGIRLLIILAAGIAVAGIIIMRKLLR